MNESISLCGETFNLYSATSHAHMGLSTQKLLGQQSQHIPPLTGIASVLHYLPGRTVTGEL